MTKNNNYILVVDPDRAVRKILRSLLGHYPLTVLETSCSSGAAQLIDEFRPCLIIADVTALSLASLPALTESREPYRPRFIFYSAVGMGEEICFLPGHATLVECGHSPRPVIERVADILRENNVYTVDAS